MLDVEAVKQRLEQEGRTRKWFADFCGLEVTSLNHVLSGRRSPSTAVLKLMAIALGCGVSDISKNTVSNRAAPIRKAVGVG